MNSKRRLVPARSLSLILLAVLALLPGASLAQEAEAAPVTSALPASEARDFLGEWVLEMESPQGAFDADLAFNDVEGNVVAELGMPRFGNRTIEDVARTESGLRLSFQSTFGDQSFNLVLDVTREGEGLKGGLAEENGLFQIPFTGITRQAFLARDTTQDDGQGEGRRRRGRRGGGSEETKITVADKEIRVRFDRTKTSDDAFEQVSEPQDGQIVAFLRSRPSKLWTDVDLHFGQTVVETHNVAENYPGVYSLWLKKAGDGWHLVFNELADVWGTQHDPSHDVAEVPLVTSQAEAQTEDLTVELEAAEGGGVLKISWGDLQWNAPFTVEEAATTATKTGG